MSKYVKYFWYVIRHKWFVFMECCFLGVPIRGLLHDNSKFRPSEFIPYANYFYGTKEQKEKYKNSFDEAWLKHIHRNPHHWQYWLLREDSGGIKNIEIPKKYLLEMIADWIGAGMAITGRRNIEDWYLKNRTKIDIKKTQKTDIENIIFPNKGE